MRDEIFKAISGINPKKTGAGADDQRKHLANMMQQTRRQFLGSAGLGLGAAFMSGLSPMQRAIAAEAGHHGLDFSRDRTAPLAPLPPQFPGKAKRVIYLHMAGAPSQHELFEYKPELNKRDGEPCPQSFLEGKRFAFLSGVPKLLGSQYPFHQTGSNGWWISDRLPHLEKHMDELCFIRSMRTDQFNHAPAQLMVQTGHSLLGYPSMGSWVTYGLGSENQNLPGYIVLLSGGQVPSGGKQLWGAGFLPSVYQGVQCRSSGEPVLYLNNPKQVSRSDRRRVLDAINEINNQSYESVSDPETLTRIAQYEMAYRMQAEASEVFDIKQESQATQERYGVTPGKTSFANNCLLARRLVENDVRFVQLYHWGWDSHGTTPFSSLDQGFADLCVDIDRPISALLTDLKERGLLEDTLVIWGGEFGRTPMKEERNGVDTGFIGRDHNPFSFTVWMAGAGVKAGYSHGETDEMGYEVARDPVEMYDFHASILYLLGFNYHDLSYPFQGLNQRLTGVKHPRIVSQIMA